MSRKRGSPLLRVLSSKLPAELAPNLHRRLVLGRPGQLPEFASNRFPKRILILALQCFSEFTQENLLALLRGDIDRSLAAAFFLASDLSNVVIVQRHWRSLPCAKLRHRMRDLASMYIYLEGIRLDDERRSLSEEDLRPAPFVRAKLKGCAPCLSG